MAGSSEETRIDTVACADCRAANTSRVGQHTQSGAGGSYSLRVIDKCALRRPATVFLVGKKRRDWEA
jgi:hypothetical protein